MEKISYEFARDLSIINGKDGKMHTEEKEDGTRYSGPMNAKEFSSFLNDQNAVLDIEL